VGAKSSDDDLQRIAPNHPVFRIEAPPTTAQQPPR
jgi:hypothetical protein